MEYINNNDRDRIDFKKLDLAFKRQENRCYKLYGKSFSFATIQNLFSQKKYIIEIRDGYVLLKKGWRKEILTIIPKI